MSEAVKELLLRAERLLVRAYPNPAKFSEATSQWQSLRDDWIRNLNSSWEPNPPEPPRE